MKLLFDIGNSRVKWGVYSNEEIHSSSSISGQGVSLSVLEDSIDLPGEITSIWISNVGRVEVLTLVTEWCRKACGVEPNLIRVSESCCGVYNKYQTQNTLGVDRWIAAIGARIIIPAGDVIVVDAGTAVTIDWLSNDNAFEGGVILPGFNLMHKALTNNTAGIKSDYSKTQKVFGRTTANCVNSGVSFGLIGAIERIVNEMKQEIDAPVKVVLTGGSAAIIIAMSKIEMVMQENLVLLGVASVSEEG